MIFSFLESLTGNFGRKDVLAEVSRLQDELRDHTLPLTEDLQNGFVDHGLSSQYHREINAALRRHVKFHGEAVTLIHESLKRIDSNLEVIEKEAKRRFPTRTAKLSYDTANLLQYLQAVGFYLRYYRKMMIRLIAEEGKRHGATKNQWARAEIEWLDEGLMAFARLYPAMAVDSSELTQAIKQLSNADLEAAIQPQAIGNEALTSRQTNLLQVGFLAPRFNPIFFLGKMRAEAQVKRYQSAQEEAQALQLRLQEMRELKEEGKASPKLQQHIQYTERRIEDLDYRIKKMQEEYLPEHLAGEEG